MNKNSVNQKLLSLPKESGISVIIPPGSLIGLKLTGGRTTYYLVLNGKVENVGKFGCRGLGSFIFSAEIIVLETRYHYPKLRWWADNNIMVYLP